jgi:cell wall-associated NlpC family hydrolase
LAVVIGRRLGAVLCGTLVMAGPPARPVGAEPHASLPITPVPGGDPGSGAPSGRSASSGPPGAPRPGVPDLLRGGRQAREEAARRGRIAAVPAEAKGLLDDLGEQAETAVERYNGERVKVARAGTAYDAAARHSMLARERLGEVRQQVAAPAVGAYQSSGGLLSRAAVLGGPGGPEGFLARATTMQVLVDRHRALLRRQAAVKTVAEVFERQAREAFAARQEAARGAADAWHAAVAAVTRQQEAVKGIERQRAALTAELSSTRMHAPALEQARATAVEQARGAAGGRAASGDRAAAGERVTAGERAGAGIERVASSRQVVPAGARPVGRAPARALPRGTDLGAVAVSAALKWLGTPYSWGGGNETGPTRGIAQGAGTVGFDCSGLVTYAWGRAGVRLVHYATAQYNAGPHPSRSELRPGDLVFFARNPADPGTIHHVGIYIGNGQMVEAPFTGARVRISPAFRPDYAGATRPVAAQ